MVKGSTLVDILLTVSILTLRTCTTFHGWAVGFLSSSYIVDLICFNRYFANSINRYWDKIYLSRHSVHSINSAIRASTKTSTSVDILLTVSTVIARIKEIISTPVDISLTVSTVQLQTLNLSIYLSRHSAYSSNKSIYIDSLYLPQ